MDSNFIPLKSKKSGFEIGIEMSDFSSKNDSENRKNEVTWGQVTHWFWSFSFSKLKSIIALLVKVANQSCIYAS